MFGSLFKTKRFRNERGQGMVSNLIAASIVTTCAAGTASLVQYLVSQSRKGQVLNRAVVQQSQLVAAILRKEQFSDPQMAPARQQQINAIKAGNSAQGFTFIDLNKNVVGSAGNRIGFTKDGEACGAADCPIFVEVDLRCGDLATAGCAAAYRVSINPGQGEVAPPPLGAPYHPPGTFTPCPGGLATFTCSDYKLTVSYESLAMSSASSCASDDVFVFGMNKTTGALRCAKKASLTCPTGQIAKNVKLVYDDPAAPITGHLEMDCIDLAKPACPDQYVFERLEVRQLDPRVSGAPSGAPNGLCRYRWRNWIDEQTQLPDATTSSSSSSSAAVCNSNVYDAVPSPGCGYQQVSASQGHCIETCNCQYDAKGNPFDCQTCHSYPWSSVSVSTQNFSASDATVTCGITITDYCGSSMSAKPVWNGKCQVKQPYLSALTKAPQWQ